MIIDWVIMGEICICEGVKIDNLVQIGYNVEVGVYIVIVVQMGVVGSIKIGCYCCIGGQVGFVGYVFIVDGIQIQV